MWIETPPTTISIRWPDRSGRSICTNLEAADAFNRAMLGFFDEVENEGNELAAAV